ncbi:MAG TPA: undecaprenyldiphospho-muramoylpentapeptide beta-N-acetylglucosaminyltransferase [Vicinamibacterales bacterium]|nr:undecaprenyldiphospho-muramoylpentapeptide beta-N-acetylglucosaminyltransferase [Vicinamibacterales bacterium]
MTWTPEPGSIERLLIAGGGTGGHLYPGLAVAHEVRRRHPGARVTFAGTARGIEARVVPREGFDLDCIRSAGLKGKSIASRVRGVAVLPRGVLDAWRVITARRPQIVVGVGGYSSGPVVLMAALRRIPTLVLEQNAVPGLTNRLLARWVSAAGVAFDEAASYFGRKAFVAGNPVRAEFLVPAGAAGAGVRAGTPRLLVVGGSQGARIVNAAMREAAPRLAAHDPVPSVVHQTGERDLSSVRGAYVTAGLPATAEAFLDPVAPAMAAADLVVCRAGATTLAELAALGRPALLVPFAAATDDHQRKNAEVLRDAGAAEVILERDLSGEALAARIGSLLSDPSRLERMGEAMHRFARPDAAARIVDRLERLVAEARG